MPNDPRARSFHPGLCGALNGTADALRERMVDSEHPRRVVLVLCTLLLFVPPAGCSATDDEAGDGAATEGQVPSAVARLIDNDRFPALVIELDSVAGTEPQPDVQVEVVAQLTDLLEKPRGIVVVPDEIIASRGGEHAWTEGELTALAHETFNLAVPDDTAKIHVMTLDGHAATDDQSNSTVGLAWANTHIALFAGKIEAVSTTPRAQPHLQLQLIRTGQFSVWLHEVGHLLGLVNVGAPMVEPHEDIEHPGHDINEDCVMFWAIEEARAVEILQQRVIEGDTRAFSFDEACRNDLAAARNML
jgi:hypothetical protein